MAVSGFNKPVRDVGAHFRARSPDPGGIVRGKTLAAIAAASMVSALLAQPLTAAEVGAQPPSDTDTRAASSATGTDNVVPKWREKYDVLRQAAFTLENEANAQALCFQTTPHRDAVKRFLDKQPLAFQWPTNQEAVP